MKNIFILLFLLPGIIYAKADKEKKLTDKDALELIKIVDDRQRNSGDYKADALIRELERDKEPKLYQALVYRRDLQNKFMILFTKPKEEAGKGYLKVDKNLWMYDPNTGKWERRTEREKIVGTNSRRSDFDESKLAEEYKVSYLGEDKLGKYKIHKILLIAKSDSNVAYPRIIMSLDQENTNLLKREEYSLSEKLMRTTYYPKWEKKYSSSKKSEVWIPQEMRIFDNLEKGNSTVILINNADLSSLQDNIFTKAWIESKSR